MLFAKITSNDGPAHSQFHATDYPNRGCQKETQRDKEYKLHAKYFHLEFANDANTFIAIKACSAFYVIAYYGLTVDWQATVAIRNGNSGIKEFT